jgi:hypothetical protein
MPLSEFLRQRLQAYTDNTVPALLFTGGAVAVGWFIQTYGPIWGLDPKMALVLAWVVALAVVLGLSALLKPKDRHGAISPEKDQLEPRPAQPINIQIQNSPTFNNNPQIDQHPINYQTQEQTQRQQVEVKSLPIIRPLEVKARDMFVTPLGEVTDSPESLFGDKNIKRPVAIADFQRVADRYSEPFVNVRTRIVFMDGQVEEYRIDDGFWFKSERHNTQFQPGDTRRLVIAVWGDGVVVPYQGKFKPVEATFITKLKYFEIDHNGLATEELRVIVEVVGVSPRGVTVLSMSAEYLLALNPAGFTLVDVRRHDLE